LEISAKEISTFSYFLISHFVRYIEIIYLILSPLPVSAALTGGRQFLPLTLAAVSGLNATLSKPGLSAEGLINKRSGFLTLKTS
jgi:hypothetical protein